MRDEDVSRYMFWKSSDNPKEAEEFVSFEIGNLENRQWNRWLIVMKDDKKIVGTCLLFYNEEERHWDISYNLGKKYWGKGFITEAMQAVMQYGKENLNMPYECNGGTIKTIGKRYVWSA